MSLIFSLFYRLIHKKTEIVLDSSEFEPCKGKIITIWSWTKLRTEKYLVHLNKNGKFTIEKVK